MDDRALLASIEGHMARGNEVAARHAEVFERFIEATERSEGALERNDRALGRNDCALRRNDRALEQNAEVIAGLRQFANDLLLRFEHATKRWERVLLEQAASMRKQGDAIEELARHAADHQDGLMAILDELRRRPYGAT